MNPVADYVLSRLKRLKRNMMDYVLTKMVESI